MQYKNEVFSLANKKFKNGIIDGRRWAPLAVGIGFEILV
jgi:hypothetical protein